MAEGGQAGKGGKRKAHYHQKSRKALSPTHLYTSRPVSARQSERASGNVGLHKVQRECNHLQTHSVLGIGLSTYV